MANSSRFQAWTALEATSFRERIRKVLAASSTSATPCHLRQHWRERPTRGIMRRGEMYGAMFFLALSFAHPAIADDRLKDFETAINNYMQGEEKGA